MSEKSAQAAPPTDSAATQRPPDEADEFNSRQLASVGYFCAAFAKAVRSFNMYSRNNEALGRFLSAAHRYQEQAFADTGDLEFNVRRDNLTMQGEDVLVDPDREAGIPFRLFREGIRRVTLGVGMDRAELDSLIELLARPASSLSLDEDLVSLLWRADLPHFSYVTLDIYDAASTDGEMDDDDQSEAIRQDLDHLLGAIYAGGSDSDESVKAINISADDLVALASLGEDRAQDTERIGTHTSRAIFNIGENMAAQLRAEVEDESDEALLELTFEVLLGVLFKLQSSTESQQVIQELVSLYDNLLMERDFGSAAGLTRQMAMYSDDADLKNVAIVRQLFTLFSSPQRLAQIAVALNDGVVSSPTSVRALLSQLGPAVVKPLLSVLPSVEQPQHRRLLCDLILEIAHPSAADLRAQYQKSEWFVDRDLLYLAGKIQDPMAPSLVLEGCLHPHARVRQQALGMLQTAPTGVADERLLQAVEDRESAVRVTAIRALVARRTPQAAETLRRMIQGQSFKQYVRAEKRTLLVAYASLAGPQAVLLLCEILQGESKKKPGLLNRLRETVEGIADDELDLRCSAAVALSSVGNPEAMAALRQGANSRHKELKDVCTRALDLIEKKQRGEAGDDGGQVG